MNNKLERRSLKKKNQGFNGIRTRDLRVAGALLPVEALIFFQASSFQLLKLENLLR